MFNVFDIGILLLFICFFIVGIKRGVILEAVNLIAIVLVFVLSFSLKGIVGNILCMLLPFSNFWGSIQGLSSLNILIYQLIAFLLVFVILLFIYEASIRISRFLQKIVNYTIILIIPSRPLNFSINSSSLVCRRTPYIGSTPRAAKTLFAIPNICA